MIKENEIYVTINKLNKNKFEGEIGEIKKIDPKELSKGSHVIITGICDICGNEKEMMYKTYYYLASNDKDNKYYCHNCSHIKTENTNLERYGVKHAAMNNEIKKKIRDTCIEKYGVSTPSQVEEFKIKSNNTCIEKYGVKYSLQSKEIKEKCFDTMINNYGCAFPIQNENIKEKIKQTNIERYGHENPMQNENIVNKGQTTCLYRYGVSNSMKNKNTIEKANATKFEKLRDKYSDVVEILSQDSEIFECKCKRCDTIFKIEKSLFRNRIRIKTTICTICNPLNSFSSSGLELQMLDFIKENYQGLILKNDKEILNGKELDVYLPELKLAFEFNGLYWHNELNKSNDYHIKKTNLCIEKGISLIHVWEDDWNYKQEIVKSIILNKIFKNKNKIYARKCEIRKLNNKTAKYFLENNHLQGYSHSSIKIGLFYNNELVSLMSFNKKRKIMNFSFTEEYEIIRYCNKINYSVIGGASKLFAYFIKNYNSEKIVSYVDRSHSNGNLYYQLGFIIDGKTPPNYYYIVDNIRKHKFNFRKDKLVREGFDINKTEHQIMLERGIFRIYNAGNLKFKYQK